MIVIVLFFATFPPSSFRLPLSSFLVVLSGGLSTWAEHRYCGACVVRWSFCLSVSVFFFSASRALAPGRLCQWGPPNPTAKARPLFLISALTRWLSLAAQHAGVFFKLVTVVLRTETAPGSILPHANRSQDLFVLRVREKGADKEGRHLAHGGGGVTTAAYRSYSGEIRPRKKRGSRYCVILNEEALPRDQNKKDSQRARLP
jgi:hypothetical protein